MSDERPIDKTALSYWFPLIKAAGIPVPITTLIEMPIPAQESIWAAFDGQDKNGEALLNFCGELKAAASAIGFPCFLRTDHTSGKHEWDRTCFVHSADEIPQHVFNIAEFSELADMLGLPWSVWVVREFLPTIPLGVCPNYGNMPLCREFRFFVDGGEVRCWHPYWPLESLEQGGADVSLYERMATAPDDYAALFTLAHKAARAIEGAWSVDILETKRGWFITDMAEAHKSFHWEGCEQMRAAKDGATP